MLFGASFFGSAFYNEPDAIPIHVFHSRHANETERDI